jgi:hypothetical protein
MSLDAPRVATIAACLTLRRFLSVRIELNEHYSVIGYLQTSIPILGVTISIAEGVLAQYGLA